MDSKQNAQVPVNYLEIARRAVEYVRTTLRAGPTNFPGDPRTEDEKEKLAKTADDEYDQIWEIVSDRLVTANKPLYMQYSSMGSTMNPMKIRAFALATISTRIGNCDPLACTAFDWLARSRAGRYAIELWQIKKNKDAEDAHVLVVIGRTASEWQDLKKWNVECVVADPWTGEAYMASELGVKMADQNGPLYHYAGDAPIMQPNFRLGPDDTWPWNDDIVPPKKKSGEGEQGGTAAPGS